MVYREPRDWDEHPMMTSLLSHKCGTGVAPFCVRCYFYLNSNDKSTTWYISAKIEDMGTPPPNILTETNRSI